MCILHNISKRIKDEKWLGVFFMLFDAFIKWHKL